MSQPDPKVNNFKITLSYDGQNYFGWQRHGDKPTLQYAIENAIEQGLGIRVAVKGSGRTDRGAHANGQVVSVKLPSAIQVGDIQKNCNDFLNEDIRVVDVESVPLDFNACDSAIAKHYRYVIWNERKLPENRAGRVWHVKEPLDVEAMIDACSVFEGEYDFSSFATRPNFKQKSTTRTVSKAVMFEELPLITFDIYANGFLYKMVRNIVRAIVKVGEGRYHRNDLHRIMKAKDRKAAPGTAPASGLYLEQVFYSQDDLTKKLGEGALL
jgi:tRNA pseudouridine38-40 synthase